MFTGLVLYLDPTITVFTTSTVIKFLLHLSDQKDVWNLLQRCTFNLSQQKMHLKAIYKMYTCQISHLYRFLWLFLRSYHMASNAKKSGLGTQILLIQHSRSLFSLQTHLHIHLPNWTCYDLLVLLLTVWTQKKSPSLKYWRSVHCWCLASANVCMLVCVFVSAVIIANYRNMSLIQMNVYIFYKWN